MNWKRSLNEYNRWYYEKPLIVIAGPTACGKTDLSINLAEKSEDNIRGRPMQVYKLMDIGTAKPTAEETREYRISLLTSFILMRNIMLWYSRKKPRNIWKRYTIGHIPIIVGGTGFYINALVYDNDFTEEESSSIRDRLYRIAETEGKEKIHDMLADIDIEYAQSIHPNNEKRAARAIEYYRLTGKKCPNTINRQKRKNRL